MWLVLMALRRPVTILVAVMSIALGSILAIRQMKVDIFPKLGAPAIYVAQPYGGMDPSQMEGYLTYYYEYHFLYITGIEHVESKNIQGVALMKLVFHPETDMSQAMAEVVGYVNRSRAFMPPGAVPPFIMRYDAGSVPVAQLVFSSESRSPGEMQDIALNRVRPIFATLPGVSAPPPFRGQPAHDRGARRPRANASLPALTGGSHRDRSIRPRRSSRPEVFAPATSFDLHPPMPRSAPNIADLLDTPLRLGSGPTVYLRDIGTIADSTDVVVGYAHVDGKRTVYIPVTKRADASTLSVIQNVRQALPRMRNVAPEDVKIDLVFDQSGYVVSALKGLDSRRAVGSVSDRIDGAAVSSRLAQRPDRDHHDSVRLAFCRRVSLDHRPDHQHHDPRRLGAGGGRAGGRSDGRNRKHSLTNERRTLQGAVCGGCLSKDSGPKIPGHALRFVRLHALAFHDRRWTPVVCSAFAGRWLCHGLFVRAVEHPGAGAFHLVDSSPARKATGTLRQTAVQLTVPRLGFVLRFRWLLTGAYLVVTAAFIYLLFPRIGAEIFPAVEARQLQLRLRAPTGTRIERTEVMALKAMDVIKETVGPDNVQITTGFIGVQPPSYPINTIFLFTSGQHEAVLGVALKPAAPAVNERSKKHCVRS